MELQQNSEAWHEWRRKGVGASEVAAIIGVCPYNTPYQIWLVKTGRTKGFAGNSFTQHGQETEAKARARYEFQTMEDVPPALATHPKYEVCRASLDGLRADGKLILEIKCPTGRATIDHAKNGVVAPQYIPQVQYQLAVTGADACHFFVFHEGSGEDALIEVLPDVELQGAIIAKVLEFWKLVESDTPPQLTDRDDKVVEDTGEMNALCTLLSQAKGLIKPALLNHYKAKVIELGGHNRIRCGRVLVTKIKDSYRVTVAKEQTA